MLLLLRLDTKLQNMVTLLVEQKCTYYKYVIAGVYCAEEDIIVANGVSLNESMIVLW